MPAGAEAVIVTCDQFANEVNTLAVFISKLVKIFFKTLATLKLYSSFPKLVVSTDFENCMVTCQN